jgi:hypothetical protein
VQWESCPEYRTKYRYILRQCDFFVSQRRGYSTGLVIERFAQFVRQNFSDTRNIPAKPHPVFLNITVSYLGHVTVQQTVLGFKTMDYHGNFFL